MTQDKHAEIVEAMARAMCHAVHPCKSMVAEIMADATYLSGREGDAAALTLAGQFRVEAEAALDIVLKAAAKIADGFRCGACGMDGAASAAILALLPEDAAGLVERLRQYEGRQWETTACYNGTRDEAASLIQSQAARIAELEAGLTEISKQTYGTEIWMDGDERAEILGRHLVRLRSLAFTALKGASHG